MGPRVPSVGVGLILIGVAVYAGTNRWMATRIVDPVNTPISLAAGHIHIPQFRLNLRASYWVSIDSGESWRPEVKCPQPHPRPQTRWVLYRDGKLFDRSYDPTPLNWPTGFEAGSGVYELDLEVLSDGSCFDPGRPRLHVWALTENYDLGAALLKCVAGGAVFVGVVILTFLPIIRGFYSTGPTTEVIDATLIGTELRSARTLPLTPRKSGLPAFGMYAGMLFALLAVLMMLLTMGFRQTSRGLAVHLLKPSQVPKKSDAWTEPLIVLLKDAGPGQKAKLYLNSRPVTWDDFFNAALKHELIQRKDWTVYVGGDDCVPWVNVTDVIDLARSYHANVFLIDEPSRKSCDSYSPQFYLRQ